MTTQSESTEKIHQALALLNEAAKEKAEELGALLHGKYGDLKSAILSAESQVVDQAKQGMHKAEDLGHLTAERIRQVAGTVDRKAHDDPWNTLGWSVVGAFLVGFLLGRRD
jgi:ElaB/YqjD/DUF883 family membrane-anchored ribosome-binding protein